MDEEVLAVLDVVSFSQQIELSVSRDEYDTYVSAIVDFCDEHDLEFDEITKYISPSLKQKIDLEAQSNGYLKKSSSSMVQFS